ncbi:MAG: hypothetical protein WD119_00505 [Pirellulaceae bacterium]
MKGGADPRRTIFAIAADGYRGALFDLASDSNDALAAYLSGSTQ